MSTVGKYIRYIVFILKRCPRQQKLPSAASADPPPHLPPPPPPPPGWMARVGSGVFLIIQMIILLDFVQCWNDTWVGYADEDGRWYYALLTATGVSYAAALALAGERGSQAGGASSLSPPQPPPPPPLPPPPPSLSSNG